MKKTAFQTAARRSILGTKHPLESLDGFYIIPRKYGVKAEQEIAGKSVDLIKKLPPDLLKKVTENTTGMTPEETGAALLDILEPEELVQALEIMSDAKVLPYDVQKTILKNGIGKHNFDKANDDGDPVESSDVSDDLVDSILEYAEVAAECLAIVQAHNDPLSGKTSKTSETSPNGSTKKQTSEPNAKTTTTEETPSS